MGNDLFELNARAISGNRNAEIARLTAEIEALRHDLERHIEIASQEAMRADGIEARLTAENARLRAALKAIAGTDKPVVSMGEMVGNMRRVARIARTALNERGQGG